MRLVDADAIHWDDLADSPCKEWAQYLISHLPDVRFGWRRTRDELPEDGQIVLIFDGSINVAKFERGISIEEREKMKRGEIENPTHTAWTLSDGCFEVKRSDSFEGADEWGNNKVPYCWNAPAGPISWFGQEVSHWMPLPEHPERE